MTPHGTQSSSAMKTNTNTNTNTMNGIHRHDSGGGFLDEEDETLDDIEMKAMNGGGGGGVDVTDDDRDQSDEELESFLLHGDGSGDGGDDGLGNSTSTVQTVASGVSGVDGSALSSSSSSSGGAGGANKSSSSSSASASGASDGHGFSRGTASKTQVAINMVISFVGAGLLGMPYAFSRAGWLLGSIALSVVSAANVYAMLCLVACRKHLEESHSSSSSNSKSRRKGGGSSSSGGLTIHGYGDLGRVILGPRGEAVVNVCLVVSQVGFATAYIIFIAANLYSIAKIDRLYVCLGCVPALALLVQAREMRTLSPFSLVADLANLAGLSAVLLQDFEDYTPHNDPIVAADWSNLLFVIAISIYSLEGVGMILPLESSCVDRSFFPGLLVQVITGITAVMILFGCAGYVAFGDATLAPITLNLQGNHWATFVKFALCLALYLTYPIMMFPVSEIVESLCFSPSSSRGDRPSSSSSSSSSSDSSSVRSYGQVMFRIVIVLSTALVAYAVPDFGKFLSLVGSSICTILGFIFPCYFHLKVFGGGGGGGGRAGGNSDGGGGGKGSNNANHNIDPTPPLPLWQKVLDVILILGGVLFGAMGTYKSFRDLFSDGDGEGEAGMEGI